MADTIIKVPDLGDSDEVEVIEILVKPGDAVTAEQALITLEGDKATMEVPSPEAGTIKELKVKIGDKVKSGSPIASLAEGASAATSAKEEKPAAKQETAKPAEKPAATGGAEVVKVPDLGDSDEVEVIEVLVKAGDSVTAEQALITLEGDKATMEVPSPSAGTIDSLLVKVGDKVKSGSPILNLGGAAASSAAPAATAPAAEEKAAPAPAPAQTEAPASAAHDGAVYAGPAVRRVAHALDVDLSTVRGSGERGRITMQDVRSALSGGGAATGGAGIPPIPAIDFSQFGPVETQKMTKIKRLTGANMQRNWLNVPMVTQYDEADITDMEAFRQQEKAAAAAQGVKLTPLVFVLKAVVAALKAFPNVNSSLGPNGDTLIVKNYYHIGVAMDTPNGLVVAVIRDVDKKSLYELGAELGATSKKAREKGLSKADMSGGCFTISSLGGIGGTAFTPIVNAPEAAILGLSKSQIKPVHSGNGDFEARLMLPLCLTYDHRIVDGAEGARFVTHLSKSLSDIRTLLL